MGAPLPTAQRNLAGAYPEPAPVPSSKGYRHRDAVTYARSMRGYHGYDRDTILDRLRIRWAELEARDARELENIADWADKFDPNPGVRNGRTDPLYLPSAKSGEPHSHDWVEVCLCAYPLKRFGPKSKTILAANRQIALRRFLNLCSGEPLTIEQMIERTGLSERTVRTRIAEAGDRLLTSTIKTDRRGRPTITYTRRNDTNTASYILQLNQEPEGKWECGVWWPCKDEEASCCRRLKAYRFGRRTQWGAALLNHCKTPKHRRTRDAEAAQRIVDRRAAKKRDRQANEVAKQLTLMFPNCGGCGTPYTVHWHDERGYLMDCQNPDAYAGRLSRLAEYAGRFPFLKRATIERLMATERRKPQSTPSPSVAID